MINSECRRVAKRAVGALRGGAIGVACLLGLQFWASSALAASEATSAEAHVVVAIPTERDVDSAPAVGAELSTGTLLKAGVGAQLRARVINNVLQAYAAAGIGASLGGQWQWDVLALTGPRFYDDWQRQTVSEGDVGVDQWMWFAGARATLKRDFGADDRKAFLGVVVGYDEDLARVKRTFGAAENDPYFWEKAPVTVRDRTVGAGYVLLGLCIGKRF